jgi:hypothetical protein
MMLRKQLFTRSEIGGQIAGTGLVLSCAEVGYPARGQRVFDNCVWEGEFVVDKTGYIVILKVSCTN